MCWVQNSHRTEYTAPAVFVQEPPGFLEPIVERRSRKRRLNGDLHFVEPTVANELEHSVETLRPGAVESKNEASVHRDSMALNFLDRRTCICRSASPSNLTASPSHPGRPSTDFRGRSTPGHTRSRASGEKLVIVRNGDVRLGKPPDVFPDQARMSFLAWSLFTNVLSSANSMKGLGQSSLMRRTSATTFCTGFTL